MDRSEEARQALQDATNRVLNAPEGTRAHALMEAAIALKPYIDAGDIPRWAVESIRHAVTRPHGDVGDITQWVVENVLTPYTQE